MEFSLDDRKRNIVFDLGKVLLSYDWESYLESFKFDKKTYEIMADAIFRNRVWEMGDEGIVTPDEWIELFVKNAPLYEAEIRDILSGIKKTISPMDYTNDWIQYFKNKGYHLYYLSNYSEKLYIETKHDMKFIEEFDGGIFSYRVKCIKPEEKIYRILLDTYQLNPKETLFFDDRKENVSTAIKMGIQGVVFTPDIAYNMLKGV